ALGRRRLPGSARRRGDPADRPHPRGGRRLLGHDHDAPVPEGARPPRGPDPPRGRRGHPARRGPGPRLRRGDRDRRRRPAPRPAPRSGRAGTGAVDAEPGRLIPMPRLAAIMAPGAVLATWSAPLPVAAVPLLPQPDSYSSRHDRVLVVPSPGVLGNDVGLLGK